MEMELLGSSAKRRRSEDLAVGELRPRATEATKAANLGHTTHSKEPPPPPDAGGGGGDDVDRISGLPDAVLGEILLLLSTKEAGRTQILASWWRHVWLASPLVIDGANLYKMPETRSFHDDGSDNKTVTAYEALAGAVSHILSAHPGPVLCFRIPSLFLHNRPFTVDAWLNSPKLDILEELEFWEQKYMILYIPPYPLAPPPSSTFRFSATLRFATLGQCELLDSSLEGIHFPHLEQLGLEDVIISEGSLHTIISSCPVLECLLLKDSVGVGCLRISSNSLVSIGVGADCPRSSNLQILQEIIIVDAPCLVRFLYLGEPMNLTVIFAPKLETLGCLKDVGFDHPRLVIGTIPIQGSNVVSLTTALTNVKILAVASWDINLDTVIELLKCFPCLEKLYIKSSISEGANRWRRKHRDFIKSFDIHLKTIVLEDYRGIRSHVNFASFFLLNVRALESMGLKVESRKYNEAFFTKQHGMLQMEKRASRGARLHFTRKICTRHIHVDHVSDLSLADPFECRC